MMADSSLTCITECVLPAAVFAVVEKAQRGGADRERTRRKPGQQTQPTLLAAAVVVVRIELVLVVVVLLRGFCFRHKIFSSETMRPPTTWVWAKGQSSSNIFY